MKYRDRILAGTAIGILMAAAPLGAHAAEAATETMPTYRMAPQPAAAQAGSMGAPVLLAQAEEEGQDRREERRRERRERDGQGGERSERRGQQADEGQGAAERPERGQQAEEPAEPRQAQPEQAQPEQAQPEPEVKPEAPKAQAEEEKQQPRERAEEAQKPQPAPEPQARQATEPPAAEAEKPAGEPAEKPNEAAGQADDGAEKPAAERKAPQRAEREGDRNTTRQRGEDRERGEARERREPAEEREASPTGQEGRDGKPAAERDGGAESERGERAGRDGRQPAEGERARGEDRQRDAGEEPPQREDAAPILDSQKDVERQGGEARRGEGRDRDRNEARGERQRDNGRERANRPLPDSDRAAQRGLNLGEIGSATAERGRRIDEADWREHRRPRDAEVVRKLGDRTIVNFDNRIIVENQGRERVRHNARDVYYEELPDNRRREVVERRDGSKVVTIRNSYGDIVQRSRIAPDGREYVLVYAGDRRRDRWVDPGRDMPPLHLTIPVSEYILESDRVSDADTYYDFLDQPPVEPVEQLYTIDDVRYSARVRDMVRRVDLDTITFATGSAAISDSEAPALEAIADAMQRMIDRNPAETFLIEGHTDAVGSDEANLVLSDERAESVAYALTDVYDIPPENLFTQGYGEQYLKIRTQSAERENRRVAIRRITPLVSPVADAR